MHCWKQGCCRIRRWFDFLKESTQVSDPIGNYIATQGTATVTLLGVIAFLVHELTKSGTLNRQNFEKHLEDLGAPEGENESPEEVRMRASIIRVIRKAVDQGVSDGSSV